MNDMDAIRHLQQSGRYRIIQRLSAPEQYRQGSPLTPRIGLVIDTETTGLDTASDKIIELGVIAFEYDAGSGNIYRILNSYNGFEDPGAPLSDEVKQITGISDKMLADQQLDDDAVQGWLEKASLIVAHNAQFDRPLLERRFAQAMEANWACTFNDINWQNEDISSRKLDYIAYRLGYFFDGHRAINDAQATLHLLTRALPVSGRLAMGMLLGRAREKSCRLFALHAPFEEKDALRAHGYQWLSDFLYPAKAGRQKTGVWSKSVSEGDVAAEQQWLSDTVYKGRNDQFAVQEITARERFSAREFQLVRT